MKNFFVIQNGTQLLNANEYIYEMKLPYKDNILIVVSTTDIIINDLETVISESEFYCEVRYLFSLPILKFNKRRIGRILSAFYANIKLKRITKKDIPDKIIIGNYQNNFCKLFTKYHATNINKVIIVDDGPSTVEIFDGKKKRLSRLNKIVEYILNLSEYLIIPDIIFTRFYSLIKSKSTNKKINIIENKYSYLKQSISNKKKTENKLFVGYPMVEENIFDINEYINLLLKVKHVEGDFIYIPHRRENKDTLKMISKHFEVKNLGMPFEMYLFKSSIHPSDIIGFFTTVLFNVNEMFGNKINLKYIKLNNLKITHINDVEKLYDEISNIARLIYSYDIRK